MDIPPADRGPLPSRLVVILFTDLVGSTALKNRLGADEQDEGKGLAFSLLSCPSCLSMFQFLFSDDRFM
jgi:class 3 adenylate cyclase